MPNIIKYHIYVTFPGVGELEVFPKNEKIRYGWVKDNDVWRKKIDTKLWFINEPSGGTHTFDIFASLELEECDCHKVDMRLTLECPGGDEEDLFTGILFFIDGEWFFDFCSVEIPARVNDPFECLFKNWETEINLISVPDPVTLNVDSGNYHEETCTEEYLLNGPYPGTPDHRINYEDGCLSGFLGNDWQVLIHTVSTIGSNTPPDTFIVETTWVREEFIGAGPPPGGGWTQVTPTLWTRPVILQGPTIEEEITPDGYGTYVATWTIVAGSLDNGRLLSEVLIYMFAVCPTYPLRSDFLGIDPDDTAPANSAYAYAHIWIWGAVMFQMSDVVRPLKFQNATKGLISPHKLLDCLRMNWRLFLYFDETNQVYRIEHISFERHAKLINLVVKRPDAIRGYNTYTYDKTKIPQKELFEWSYKTNDEDWDNSTIIYPDCSDVGNIKTYKIDCYHTDFQSLFDSQLQDIDLLKGMMIVSQKDGEVNRGIGDISGLVKANAGLSWANIVRHLWRWRMPSCAALVNGVMTDFLSLIPKIKQTTFQAEICCVDILQINPAIDRVRTGLGNGEMEPFDMDLGTGLTDFSLLFAPPIINGPEIPDVLIIETTDERCTWGYLSFELNQDLSLGIGIEWDFGMDAMPATASGAGPHSVYYSTPGSKIITATLSSGSNTVVVMYEVFIVDCPVLIVASDDILCFYQDFIFSLDTILPLSATVAWDFGGAGAVPLTAVGEGPHTVYYIPADTYIITATITYDNHVEVLTYSVQVAECDPNIFVDDSTPCYYTDVVFTLEFIPEGTFAWDFGAGAVPATATGPGPQTVQYLTTGVKTITCTITHPDATTTDLTIMITVSACPGQITGHVYNDSNVGQSGRNVRLFHDDDIDGISDGGAPVKSVNSGVGGTYSMPNITPGNYVLVINLFSGTMSITHESKDYTPDGDIAPDIDTYDITIPVTIGPGETDGGNDFYIIP